MESVNHGSEKADIVLRKGYVYTVDLRGNETEAQAVAIKSGKILYCGCEDGVDAFIGRNTQVIDLEGKMALPGFSDAHNHACAMTTAIFALDLYPYPSKVEYLGVIEQWLSEHPESAFVTGNGWSLANLDNTYPDREELDRICPDVPAAFFDATHHILWANSKAISLAGITKYTQDPPGGVIVRNPNTGDPTGVFIESAASDLVMDSLPDFEIWQYKIGIQAYQQMANSLGITLSQDCFLKPGSNGIEAYKELAKEGLLTLRMRGTYGVAPSVEGSSYKPIETAEKDFDEIIQNLKRRKEEDHIGDLFQMNAIKLFEDGGGHTSFMKEPFEDFDDCGKPIWPMEQLKAICRKAEETGFQIHVHCMGDAAVSSTIDAIRYANPEGSDRRHSITHLMLVDEADIQRMADSKIVGVPQPFWMTRDDYYSKLYMSVMGEERTNRCYPMKGLVDRGVVMASASDWPITNPCPPLVAIQCGVTRTIPYDDPDIPMQNLDKNPEYRYPLGPNENREKECVNLKTMIQAATINGAFATFTEDLTGSITQEKSADLVILDRNIFSLPSCDLAKANIMMTIFKGNIVYAADTVTVSDRKVITRKTAPVFPEDPTPYVLTVAAGTTIKDLARALNPPMGGSFEILVAGIPVGADSMAPIPENAVVHSVGAGGTDAMFTVIVAKSKIQNSFSVSEVSEKGCRIIFDKAVSGLTENDVFFLEDKSKLCARTVSTETSDSGKTYFISAIDRNSKTGLISGENYEVYAYAEGYEFKETRIIAIP